MKMKIPLLNKSLSKEKSASVIFPYPPVALPISLEGVLTAENLAKEVAYATFVFSTEENIFYIFEFNQEIVDGLTGYRARHGRIANVEILLSRENNGSLRMTTGRAEVPFGIISKDQYKEYEQYHDKLFARYMSKLGRTMHEYLS